MSRRKRDERRAERPQAALGVASEPCIMLMGDEMRAWQYFKAAANELLQATNILKAATADKQTTAETLLNAGHDAIVDAQVKAQAAAENERTCVSVFQQCQARYRDALTALSAAAAPAA